MIFGFIRLWQNPYVLHLQNRKGEERLELFLLETLEGSPSVPAGRQQIMDLARSLNKLPALPAEITIIKETVEACRFFCTPRCERDHLSSS